MNDIDKIVEDFRNKQKHITNHGGFLEYVGEEYEAIDFDMETMEGWLKQALLKAKDIGVREERERIITGMLPEDMNMNIMEVAVRNNIIKEIKNLNTKDTLES